MMNDTQYTPWLELGIDELAYYKKRFLETCAELAAWKAEAMEARKFIAEVDTWWCDGLLFTELYSDFKTYLAARVKDGE